MKKMFVCFYKTVCVIFLSLSVSVLEFSVDCTLLRRTTLVDQRIIERERERERRAILAQKRKENDQPRETPSEIRVRLCLFYISIYFTQKEEKNTQNSRMKDFLFLCLFIF